MMRPTKEEWKAIRRNAEGTLEGNESIAHAFRIKVTAIFEAMLADKPRPFKRRPPVSLRLICDGGPPAKLIVHPNWHPYAKEVEADILNCELLQEESTTGWIRDPDTGEKKEVEARSFRKILTFVVWKSCGATVVGTIYQTAANDAARAVEVMRDFLEDQGAVFARSHDNCCVCGKGLSDELSRSRGIGPECIKAVDYKPVEAVKWNSIVTRQEAHATAPEPEPAEDEAFTLSSR